MKGTKILLLLAALLVPALVFIFLKIFGRNEFAVAPLFTDEQPEVAGCAPVTLPYYLPDSVVEALDFGRDSLLLVAFGEASVEAKRQRRRVEEETKGAAPRQVTVARDDARYTSWHNCIFFLKEPFDLVLVDKAGVIRGQYTTDDRDEIDRLLTELTIIQKRY